MESIISINNKYGTPSAVANEEKDIDVEDRSSEGAKSVSPPASASSASASAAAATASQDRHGHVSSFLKFSIQNILQQAAASSGASAAAAAVAAAATRRSNDLIQSDMAAAVMSADLDMKRAVGTLPFW